MSRTSDPKTSVTRRGFIGAMGLAPAVLQAVGTQAEGGSRAAAPGFWHSPRRSGVLLADLSGAEPREAISSKPRKGCWYTIPYRTETGIRGVMVARGQLTHPPDLRLSLPVQGWHAIYVGLFGGARIDEFRLRLKLSDERLFESLAPSRLGYQRKPDGSWLRPRPAIGVTDIEEVFWKAADLGGQQLVISHLRTSHEDITPRNMPGSRYARQARKAYDGGAAGLAFWDSRGRMVRKTQWHAIRRLGHRKDLEAMALQPREYRVHPLKLIDGWSVELRYR